LASAAAIVDLGGAIVLTRSAHDLGASFFGGDVVGVVCSAITAESSALAWAAASTAFARGSLLEGWNPAALPLSEVVLAGACFDGRDGRGILGIAGTIVETEAIERWALLFGWLGCCRGVGTAAEDGVVGCVESVSEGS